MNTPLTNFDIENMVAYLTIPNFKGVFMRDNLPKTFLAGESMVINLDSSIGNGTHWVGAYHDGTNILYFDSFGIQPPDELKKYKKKIKFQTMQVQHNNSVRCGWYVLYFLNEVNKGVDYYDLIYYYDILNQFKNENALKNYFNRI